MKQTVLSCRKDSSLENVLLHVFWLMITENGLVLNVLDPSRPDEHSSLDKDLNIPAWG